MKFEDIRYQSLSRIGNQEVEGITDGTCSVFYKIDGTNGVVWWDPENGIQAGSRNRVLGIGSDNAGFCNYVYNELKFIDFFKHPDNRDLVIYGEWLVPHSLKTYRDDAWRRFYVFDIYDGETGEYLPYDAYKGLLDDYGIDYIPELARIKNPSNEDLYRLLEKSGQFLVKDGMGNGEGIVIKNYDYVNKYGRQIWAKLITNEFKEVHHKEMGAPLINGTVLVEEKIVRDYLTESFILKEQAKVIIRNTEPDMFGKRDHAQWDMKMIPELLGRVWYEFIREETTTFLKDLKNPTINFRLLNNLVIKETKRVIGV